VDAVRTWLLHGRRILVENAWVKDLIQNDLIRIDRSDSEIAIVVYPDTPTERIVRNRDLNRVYSHMKAKHGSVEVQFGYWAGLDLIPPPPGRKRSFTLARLIWGPLP
jgi:hypothetical protein